MEVLSAGARVLGLELSAEQERRFLRYRDGLVEWNQRMNLTSRTALEEIERVHFLDSLSLVPLLRREGHETARVIDVGTGAGFPGVPVKLLMPATRLTLVEATRKKADFLRWLVVELELDEVVVVVARAEELAHQPDYREAFDVAVARALGGLSTALELTLPFCALGGLVVVPQAGDVGPRLAGASQAAEQLGGHLRSLEPLIVPGLRDNAVLVIVDKVAATEVRYPRRTGVPAHRPLAH